MKRLYLTITDVERAELKHHLIMNGYYVEWDGYDVIDVDEEEIAYVKTILLDRQIPFTDNVNEIWFGNKKIKSKIDKFYNLAIEIMNMVGDIGEYTDEENEVIEEVANVINIYEEVFEN